MLQIEEALCWFKYPVAHPILEYVNEVEVTRRVELLVRVVRADEAKCQVGHNVRVNRPMRVQRHEGPC